LTIKNRNQSTSFIQFLYRRIGNASLQPKLTIHYAIVKELKADEG